MKRLIKNNVMSHLVLPYFGNVAKMSVEEILQMLKTDFSGLDPNEAKKRLEFYGTNEIKREKPAPWYIQIVKAFLNPFIGILVFLAIVSYITDVLFVPKEEQNWITIVIIIIMVLISGFLRFFQEYRSLIKAERLKSLVKTTVAVRRRTAYFSEINMEEIVPGDVIYLAAGDIVPADVRIISAKDLFIDQSTLTGESEPVEKFPNLREEFIRKDSLSLHELDNICFMGTSVVSGTGVGVVLLTGERTYFGSMAKEIMGKKSKTSFEEGIDNVSKVFIKFMLIMFPIVLLINGLTKGDWLEALLFSLAVAVGLTPEMLPMIVTANLAKGAVKMAKKKTIVKSLNAIQNFGAIDVLCTDKTGTLTQNRVILEKHINVHGVEDDRVLRHAFLNSYYQTGLKNLLDFAVLEHGEKQGLNGKELEKIYTKVDEIPFDFQRKRMSVVLESKNGNGKKRQLITKGAVEEVLSICTYAEYGGAVVELTEKIKDQALKMVKKLSEDGMRVIAVAQKNNVPMEGIFSVADESDMVLIGFLAFLDPPKETASEAISALKDHGITIKILTGDNEIVSKKIAKEVGIPVEGVLLGDEIERMTDQELIEKVDEVSIFAKLNPLQKSRIVRALREKGHVVGFLGDGINDAPAMKEADIAISVDNAVDIAKESADIILLEKSLRVLEEGIMEGRKIFANIMKYIAITASSNFGNVFSVLVASAFLPFLPMAPLQFLFLNLTYDFSMTTIPWDNVDEDYLKKPRKWNPVNIGRFMVWFGPVSSIFDITTYIFMFFVFSPLVAKGAFHSLPEDLKTLFINTFHTGWFIESLWTQTFVVHTLRTEKIPFVQSVASLPLLLFQAIGLFAGTVLPYYTPIGRSMGLYPLPTVYFVFLLLPTITLYLLLAQYVKVIYMKRYGNLL